MCGRATKRKPRRKRFPKNNLQGNDLPSVHPAVDLKYFNDLNPSVWSTTISAKLRKSPDYFFFVFRTDSDCSVLLSSGLHFSSLPGLCLTCPGLSSSHDPCVCPRDLHFHLRKSVSLNIGVLQPQNLHGYAGAESGQLGEVRGCCPLPAQPWPLPRPKTLFSPCRAIIC